MCQTSSFKLVMGWQQLLGFYIFQFPFSINHFLTACQPKTPIRMAGGRPANGHAELRMKTFEAWAAEDRLKVSQFDAASCVDRAV